LFKAEYVDLARKFCLLGATNDDLERVFEIKADAGNAEVAA
jgi:hypothetical protein